MATLNGIDLGDIQSERQSKQSSLFQQPLPGSDSSGTLLLDIFGVSRTITIDAVKEDTAANLKIYIESIEALINGSQSAIAYVGPLLTGSINVLIDSFEWTYDAGAPTKISYTLNLVEGSI